ncbi:peptide deformylase [Cognatishimia sp. F0-27]|uniref:peptide deformylase n=1 Tax=Cognatishimia sp. F0-27 TaxID=2816855 RepID=UPI001D0C6CC5|nr:peptide deformylase [Cognatishimia sp. F0-27]MCC1491396.1 peptide deformylase [Cognatishimia sp. F0-27]
MSARPFLIWPDKRLLTPAAPVAAVDDAVRAVWDDMVAAMHSMAGGVGLAAPQIGVGLRLAIVDASESGGAVVRMANPEILHASVKMRSHEEASPNLPGISAMVTRPRAVTLRFLDETGATVERDFVGLWATSAQHQVDHLDGKLFVHRLSKVKRDMLLKKFAKRR